MDWEKLKKELDGLLQGFDYKGRILNDPLGLVRRFQDPKDQELAGLIASALAYGRVAGILKSVDMVFSVMDYQPYRFIAEFTLTNRDRFDGIIHRFHTGSDISALVWGMHQVLEEYGSIQALFSKGYREEEENIKWALVRFVEGFMSLDYTPIYGKASIPERAGLHSLLPSPLNGSSCKRLNLYLRWMIRPDDGLDLGLWKGLSPSKLVIPLDTHIVRISRYIGLTRLRTPNWRMAENITRGLKRLDPADPLKYDFALCHLGISGLCRGEKAPETCGNCQIKEICSLE